MLIRLRQSLGLQALGRFAGDRRGVSAVEFALLAPLMISLYLGSVEVSDGVIADRKVTLTAAALANLTAQVATISTSDMTNILDASSAIIAPYSAGNLKMTVTCVNIDANKKATVKWSVTRNGANAYRYDHDSRGPGGGQLATDFRRGVLRLHADHRLYDHRHADAGRSNVHEPAHLGADLQQTSPAPDLHLSPGCRAKRSAARWSA